MANEQKKTPDLESGRSYNQILKNVKTWFEDLLDLNEGVDVEGTIISINNNKRMRGASAWLLVCSIMIASLGLDLNSPAVIIGAMLISPLMSPILGIGMGVAINDRRTLNISVQHFFISICIALVTSVLYFKITPLGLPTPEIISRTRPTFLDGLVAVFGGFAGIISVTRKDKSNAIPGVAIATALMPPLCVSGYGIANGNVSIAINAFYLFFLNSFFIALTTYSICKLLGFPMMSYPDAAERRKTSLIALIISLIIIIPSTTILYGLWEELQTNTVIESFKNEHFDRDKNTVCTKYDIIASNDSTDAKILVMQLIGMSLNDEQKTFYKEELSKKIEGMSIRFLQDDDIDITEFNELKKMYNKTDGQIEKMLENQAKMQDSILVSNQVKTIGAFQQDSIGMLKLGATANLIPEVKKLGFSEMYMTNTKVDSVRTEKFLDKLPLLVVDWEKGVSAKSKAKVRKNLYDYLTEEAELDTLVIVSF